MRNVPFQLANDLQRLRDDSRIPRPGDRATEGLAEIEELVDKAIHLYGRLNRQHERWANPIREGRHPFDLEEGKAWQAAFQRWCDDARQIIRQAKALQSQGLSVDQQDVLHSTLLHCDYDGVDIERLIANAALLQQGKGTPLAEITHELQRRLGANGQG